MTKEWWMHIFYLIYIPIIIVAIPIWIGTGIYYRGKGWIGIGRKDLR